MILGFVLFLDQMQSVPKPIVTSPTIPEDNDPPDPPDPPEPPTVLNSQIVRGDIASISDDVTLTQFKPGWSISQQTLGDGLVQITYKIENGSTLFYLL